jgi:hypothetical protein
VLISFGAWRQSIVPRGNVPVINLPSLPDNIDPAHTSLYYYENSTWTPIPNQSFGGGTISAHLDKFGYYSVFSPILNLPYAFNRVFVFPNPVGPDTVPTLHVEVGQSDDVSYRIYDSAGELVEEGRLGAEIKVIDGVPAYEQALDGSRFRSGVYVGAVTAKKAGEETLRINFRFTVKR